MKILSFDNNGNYRIKRDSDQNNLFDIFQKNIVNNLSIGKRIYIVPREYEMRLDRISEHLYGSSDYVEELMILNDLISPYSVKEGQYIYFCQYEDLVQLYTTDEIPTQQDKARQALINSIQTDRNKKNLFNDANLPISIKPTILKQVSVTNDNKIKIINTFE